MVPKRSVAVVVAVVLATIASAGAYLGLRSAQQGADRNAAVTSVYVLKGLVPRNDSGAAAYAQGLIKATRLPRQFVPAGAVTNLSSIRDRVAGSDLPAGEIVVGGMFVSLTAIAGAAAQRVPPGDVAVSVSVDRVHAVAGLIRPGDKVDILVDIGGASETFLYQSVPVLAVGTTLVPAPGTATAGPGAATQAGNVITFAVAPAAAARISQANSGGGGVTGGVYLALAAPGNAVVAFTTITGANLIPGSETGPAPTISGVNPLPGNPTSGGRLPTGRTNEKAP
jgi:pilus assembly protein CpaB